MDTRKLVLPAAVFVGGALLGRMIGFKGLIRAGMAALTVANMSETAGLLTAGKRETPRKAPAEDGAQALGGAKIRAANGARTPIRPAPGRIEARAQRAGYSALIDNRRASLADDSIGPGLRRMRNIAKFLSRHVLLRGRARRLPARPSRSRRRATRFAGKTVQMIIGFGPGGGYDLWGRTVARHIGKHLPGKPNVVPQNMPGAGSYVATSHIYNVAPKDGTVMGIIARDAALGPLVGRAGRALRRHPAVVDRQPGQGNQCLHRVPHRTGEDRPGPVREAADPRRHRAGHRHPLLSQGAQRVARHEVQARRRLSRPRPTCSWRWSAARWRESARASTA